ITYSKKSDSHSLRASYLEAVGSERVEASGEEIASAAKKIDIPVEEELIESRTSIESCFDSQGNFCPNRVGEMMISFLIGAEWKMLQPKIRQQVARKLIDLVDQNGDPHLRFIDTAAWIVHKES
ncbi:MAG TPA: hypothetical protein VFX86_02370, partial [Candidatus Saccharimonadales bacterium]|nr:hypothetical protein [Candidatus Saccharimonadales bacterium]